MFTISPPSVFLVRQNDNSTACAILSHITSRNNAMPIHFIRGLPAEYAAGRGPNKHWFFQFHDFTGLLKIEDPPHEKDETIHPPWLDKADIRIKSRQSSNKFSFEGAQTEDAIYSLATLMEQISDTQPKSIPELDRLVSQLPSSDRDVITQKRFQPVEIDTERKESESKKEGGQESLEDLITYPMSFPGHAFTVSFAGNKVLITNTGLHSGSNPGTFVFNMSKALLTDKKKKEEIRQKFFLNLFFSPDELMNTLDECVVFKKKSTSVSDILRSSTQFEPNRTLSDYGFVYKPHKYQKRGNCCYSSPKKHLHALIAYNLANKKTLQDIHIAFADAEKPYKKITKQLRETTIKNFLASLDKLTAAQKIAKSELAFETFAYTLGVYLEQNTNEELIGRLTKVPHIIPTDNKMLAQAREILIKNKNVQFNQSLQFGILCSSMLSRSHEKGLDIFKAIDLNYDQFSAEQLAHLAHLAQRQDIIPVMLLLEAKRHEKANGLDYRHIYSKRILSEYEALSTTIEYKHQQLEKLCSELDKSGIFDEFYNSHTDINFSEKVSDMAKQLQHFEEARATAHDSYSRERAALTAENESIIQQMRKDLPPEELSKAVDSLVENTKNTAELEDAYKESIESIENKISAIKAWNSLLAPLINKKEEIEKMKEKLLKLEDQILTVSSQKQPLVLPSTAQTVKKVKKT